MVEDDQIRKLIALGTENRNLDYKGPLSWASLAKDEKLGLAKDVLAFANTRDGGVILVGVDDKTGILVGLSDADASSFDTTTFNDFIHTYTDPRHTSSVYRRVLDGKNIVVIEIPEFADVPIVCKQEAGSSLDSKRILLRRAAIYKRTDKATSQAIDDADELRELLNRALLRRQDELMAAMSRIINPQRQPELQLANYDPEITETDEFIGLRIHNALTDRGYWTITFRPVAYVRNRIPELKMVQSMVRESRVTTNGRHFPYLAEANASNFNRGFQSWADFHDSFTHRAEGFRAYTSGLFRWRGIIWEDSHVAYAGKNVISEQGMIFSFADWLTYAQRYYERFLPVEESLTFEFVLAGARGRQLIFVTRDLPVPRGASQESNVLVFGTVSMAELRSDTLGVARREVRRAFEIFNWSAATDETIADWQRRIDGRF
jgi:hypothetical protein